MFFGGDARNRAPAGEREAVGVQRAEAFAAQPGLAFGGSGLHQGLQLAEHAPEQLGVVGLERRLHFGLIRKLLRHEDVRERRVHRVVHPGQRREGLCAGQGLCGQKAHLREELVQVQDDGHNLCDGLAVVHQHGHLTAWVDGFVVVAVLLAFVQLDHAGFKFGTAHFQQHVRHKRTGAGGKVKFQAHGWGLQKKNQG